MCTSGSPLFQGKSNHPIIMTNAFPYGDVGLEAPGVQVHLPLSSTLSLAFLCPSYLRQLRFIDDPALPIDDARRDRFRSLRDGIVKGTVAIIPADDIRALNRLQVATSSRYLYAAANDFELARTMQRKDPKLRQVDSLVRVGKMGRGPSRCANMPDGLHLVLLGAQDHGMLALEAVDPDGEGITASTADSVGLDALMRIGPLIEAQLFDDRHQIRGMKEIKLEVLEPGASTRFRVVPRDEAIQSLFTKLDSERR